MQNPWCRLTTRAFAFAATFAAAQVAGAGDGSGARIIIGTSTAAPGARTTIEVTLATDVAVGGTENEITFTPPARIVARANGNPDCQINPVFRRGTGFAFLPMDCDPATTCTGVRALILALSNPDGFPNGSLLYTCNVAIPADTPAGTYRLEISNVAAADLEGQPIDATGTSGAVIVELPSPTPTNTPARTASATPASADDDGCAIGAPAPGLAWWLLAPVIVSWAIRRRMP